MKKITFILAAMPLAVLAGQASAQAMANARAAVGVQNRIANLEVRFNAGLGEGVFTNAERDAINRKLTELRDLERNYSANGLTVAERRTLQQRVTLVRNQIRVAGGSDWANQYGWSDAQLDAYADSTRDGRSDDYNRGSTNGDARYDRYGRANTNSGVVYDQQGRPMANGGLSDQYGRPVASGQTYGNSGQNQQAPRSADVGNVLGGVLGSVAGGGSGVGGVLGGVLGGGGGVSGVLGSVLGGGGGVGGILGSILGRGGLRTGEVVNGGLASVLGSAAGLGSQYRDNNNVYYRSDGERVYEIDARTNTVTRVYPVER